MPKDDPPRDLADWLGLARPPHWTRSRLLGGLAGVLLVVLVVFLLGAALWLIASALRASAGSVPGATLGAGGLIVALLGAPFLIWNTAIRQTTLNFQREGHMTDRISKAVEQLGAEKTVKLRRRDKDGTEITVEESRPNIEVRIGAILSLERIAQDSTRHDRGRDHVRVMEILCAYVRENAPASGAEDFPLPEWEPLEDDVTEAERETYLEKRQERFGQSFDSMARAWAGSLEEPRADVRQALRVIGRRDAGQRQAEARWGADADPRAEWIFDTPPPQPPESAGEAAIPWAEMDAWKVRLAAWKERADGFAGYRPDLRHTDLQGADLSGLVLSGAKLKGARLEGANLEKARLEGAELWQARLEGASLGGARLEGANLGQARLEGANLASVQMQGAYLRGVQMEGAFLGTARMEGANLEKARMEGAYLWHARLQGANLGAARIEGADLTLARMEGSNLRQARMEGADLGDARLRGAVLREVDLSSVTILRRQVASAFGDASVILPGGTVRPAHWPERELDWQDFDTEYRRWLADPAAYRPPPPP
ncbi:MAG: pentapeptide repeat-containing protein [Paracoccaceae bacterium]|nr:MAG: pentapeptide repeat-containing protein [Paracoccaceae bacterium]